MSDEKSKVTDKAGEIAKNIWLAGVGAYGKAVEDAQGRLEKPVWSPPNCSRSWSKRERPSKTRPAGPWKVPYQRAAPWRNGSTG